MGHSVALNAIQSDLFWSKNEFPHLVIGGCCNGWTRHPIADIGLLRWMSAME
jgi:hypothetical protein